ncbi:Hint domain-containing protein [Synechococcus sp. GreenBA-s]|nr:Hint domain-containing protein [Synechococcus sp. GreenBA-s]
MATANFTYQTGVSLASGGAGQPNTVTSLSGVTGPYTLSDDLSDGDGFVYGGETITVTVSGVTTDYNYTGTSVNYGGVDYPIYVSAVDANEYIFSDAIIDPGITSNEFSPTTSPPLCLMQGVLIRSSEGHIPVERLRIGDLVATPDGLRRVHFVGESSYRAIDLRITGEMPIRIEAGAFGELGPVEPIQCSPNHAFLIDGCLVEAKALINGTTIRQLASWDEPTVTYYSIELEEHGLVWANGLLTETYFACRSGENDSREAWDNHAEYLALYGKGGHMRMLVQPRIPLARNLPNRIRQLVGLSQADMCSAEALALV